MCGFLALPYADHVAVLMGKKTEAADNSDDGPVKQQNPMDLVGNADATME